MPLEPTGWKTCARDPDEYPALDLGLLARISRTRKPGTPGRLRHPPATAGRRCAAPSMSGNICHHAGQDVTIAARKDRWPSFLGMDSHAPSEPALDTAVEVLAANDIELVIQADHGYTPTPVISHAILTYNRNRHRRMADGIVITLSHNPPDDGGFGTTCPAAAARHEHHQADRGPPT